MNVSEETSFHLSRRIRASLASLPEAERRVAAALLSAPEVAMHESVGRLAARASVSPATIVRLSRRLGYDGFAALKIAIAQEAGRGDPFGHAGHEEAGTSRAPYRRVMDDDVQAIRDAIEVLDARALSACVDAVADAAEILLCGVGASAACASLAALRFSALGLRASAAAEPLTQLLHACRLTDADVCIAISQSGESRDTIDAIAGARSAGATTIAVTSFAGSPLADAAALALVCAGDMGRATARELFANPVAVLSVLGALHAEVAARRPAADGGAAAARLVATRQY